MTGQDVINAVSVDIRQVLGASGADASIILGWVDRIHKDVLHRSPVYAHFNRLLTTVTTTVGNSSYTLAPSSPIRRVTQVYDRTTNRPLLDVALAVAPFYSGSDGSQPPNISEEQVRAHGMMYEKVQATYPVYFRFIAPTTLFIFPAPATATWAGTVEVYSENLITTLASTVTTLVVPDDGLDVMVAGVNYLANQYLQRGQEAQLWMGIYERVLTGKDIE